MAAPTTRVLVRMLPSAVSEIIADAVHGVIKFFKAVYSITFNKDTDKSIVFVCSKNEISFILNHDETVFVRPIYTIKFIL